MNRVIKLEANFSKAFVERFKDREYPFKGGKAQYIHTNLIDMPIPRVGEKLKIFYEDIEYMLVVRDVIYQSVYYEDMSLEIALNRGNERERQGRANSPVITVSLTDSSNPKYNQR